ncbi:amidase [Pseudomonas sp. GD03860]|uniref:amidase n=1 Tax=Pseudomonas TaxID=286 RepID=UPI002363518C|nr:MULTISPECIES: amidase [Pseudomonas]MDD2057546.1 amidase [Pseudomonas putida]MDH0635860.1 amidase [Pseudomonas sp. GD03860]
MKRLVLALLLLAGAWGWYERQALADFPGILSAYSAKQYCSCRFVMGFDAPYCRGYVRQYLPLSRLEEDSQARQVTVAGLGVERRAAWRGAREGCGLLP